MPILPPPPPPSPPYYHRSLAVASPPGVTVYRVIICEHQRRITHLICWERVSRPYRRYTFAGHPLMTDQWEPLRDLDGSPITRSMHVVGAFIMPPTPRTGND